MPGVTTDTPPPPATADSKRPNILYIMADQMAAPMLRMYNPNSVIKTPNLDRLAAEGVCFDSAYCNSPLCAPSRFTMVTGQLPSRIGGYDNAADLPGDVPTYAHYLRAAGYHTALSGKMHFCGPDQLHGFEERLTSDIYPGDYGWSVNWDEPEIRPDWYHDMASVLEAGPIVRTNQLDYDEEVIFKATQWLHNHVRHQNDQPFALTVSMTHPHDPYAMTRDYWDLYDGVEIPMPTTTAIPHDHQDPHSARILKCIDLWGKEMPEQSIRNARRAYFAACSFVDAQIGKLLKVLEDTGLDRDTIIVFSGDHGDMLGERGLWYKMSWFENSARVPMIVHAPGRYAARHVKESVSTMDLMPTFVQMSGRDVHPQLPIDGISLMPYITGAEGPKPDTVLGEYMGEGTICPVVMIRRGPWKFVYAPTDPPQLYNVAEDPHERNNLAAGYSNTLPALSGSTKKTGKAAGTNPGLLDARRDLAHPPQAHENGTRKEVTNGYTNGHANGHVNGHSNGHSNGHANGYANGHTNGHANGSTNGHHNASSPPHEIIKAFLEEVAARWDLERIRQQVLTSQRRRRLVYDALDKGLHTTWEFVTPVDAANQYIRNKGKIALLDVETYNRWPRPATKAGGRS